MISASPFFISMAIIWENGFKGKPTIIAAPIENPLSLPLEEKEEIDGAVNKEEKSSKGFGR